jgi:hypothetical protein
MTAVAGCVALGARDSFAGPPLVTDDAGTVDVGHLEVELNGSYTHDSEREAGVRVKSDLFDGEIKLTTGLLKDVGVSLVLPYTFSERGYEGGDLTGSTEGVGDMLFELKYLFFQRDDLALTLKPTVLIPTGRYSVGLSEGRWQPGVALIATQEFDDGKYALHGNLGYEHHTYRTGEARAENRSDLWSASVAGEAEVAKNLTAMLDFGVARSSDTSTSTPAVYGLAGFRYEVNRYLDVDCGVKLGLTKPEDDVAALYGIVLKF